MLHDRDRARVHRAQPVTVCREKRAVAPAGSDRTACPFREVVTVETVRAPEDEPVPSGVHRNLGVDACNRRRHMEARKRSFHCAGAHALRARPGRDHPPRRRPNDQRGNRDAGNDAKHTSAGNGFRTPTLLITLRARLGQPPARVAEILHALPRIFLETERQKRHEGARQRGGQALPVRLLRQDGGESERDVLAVEGSRSGQRFVKAAAERPHVGAAIDRAGRAPAPATCSQRYRAAHLRPSVRPASGNGSTPAPRLRRRRR